MAREWFRADNCSLEAVDRSIVNRATRRLVDDHDMSPTAANLSTVRMTYREGMSAAELIKAVQEFRERAQSDRLTGRWMK